MKKNAGHETLCRVLLGCVWAVCLLFFAFFAGTMCGDRTGQEAAVVEIGEPRIRETAAADKPRAEREPAAQERKPDVCEDTYLSAEIPLSYEEQAALYGACLEFRVSYELALAVVEQETDFRNIVGDDGASVGYMQIQQRWWGSLMEEIGARDLTVAEDNFRTGCAILRQLLDQYSLEDALSVYNTGAPGQTRYSREVMGRMEHGQG